MSNPPRQKGTKYETALLPDLRNAFGDQVERAPLKGQGDKGDFTGVPFPCEAKNTNVPHFVEWARTTAGKCAPDGPLAPARWIVLWSGGDARKKGYPGELVLMPKKFALELLGRSSRHFRERMA